MRMIERSSVPGAESVNNASHVEGRPTARIPDPHPDPWGFEHTNARVAARTTIVRRHTVRRSTHHERPG